MTARPPANVAASVRARLLTLSKARGEDLTLTLVNYGIERFLYRMSRSDQRDQFVLKGAVLFALRVGAQYRPTRDLDLLGRGEASSGAVATATRDIIATDVDDDGLQFDPTTIEVDAIRDGDRYGGLRVTLQASLAGARVPLQVDIGFGDAVTPPPTVVRIPPALPTSPAALVATFARRQTAIPEGVPPALTDTFAQDRRTQSNWTSFVTRSGLENSGALGQALETIRGFVLAPLAAAHSGASFDKQWAPGGPWR